MDVIKPKSSHIASYTYDPALKILSVTFKNGATYHHKGVPQEAYDNMLKYRSPGEHYHHVIKRYALHKPENKG